MGNSSFALKHEKITLACWVIFFALLILNYIPTFKWMIFRFELKDSYSAHGYLIPFVSLWLIWTLREKLRLASVQPNRWGFGLVVLSLIIHCVSGLADVNSISGFSLLTLIAGFLLLDKGNEWLKILWFPIAFLFFMIPLPDFIITGLNFKLKFLASDFAAFCLNSTGLAAIREGSYMVFSDQKLAIGDVCSGLRSLISLVALGVLYAWLIRGKGWPHIITALATIIPAAVLGNGLRICLVCYLVHWLGQDAVFKPIIMDYDLHLFTGTIIFAGALGFLYLADSLLAMARPKHA